MYKPHVLDFNIVEQDLSLARYQQYTSAPVNNSDGKGRKYLFYNTACFTDAPMYRVRLDTDFIGETVYEGDSLALAVKAYNKLG